MAKSLLDRLSAKDYALIRHNVYYDPTSESGLRWATELYSRNGRGHSSGDSVGKNFFIGKNAYQSSCIVLILHDIWPEDDQHVATRKDPSGPWGDVANLEWTKRGDIRRRNAELSRIALVRSVLGDDGPDLGDRLRLNMPCLKGHLWNGYQLGLQKKNGHNWRCQQCEKEKKDNPKARESRKQRRIARYQANIEEERRNARERMRSRLADMSPEELQEHRTRQRRHQRQYLHRLGRKSRSKALNGFVIPPHLLGHGLIAQDIYPFLDAGVDLANIDADAIKESRTLWLHLKNTTPAPTVLDLVEKQARSLISSEKIKFLENGGTEEEWCKECRRRRYRIKMATDPEYVIYMRQKSKRRKAQMRNSVAIQISGRQIRARFAEFNNRCAYCGSYGDLHIEHVIPISKGGPHAIGNIIPACKDCNYSKSVHDVESWYRAQPFFNELRWGKICRMLNWQRSSVGQLALL